MSIDGGLPLLASVVSLHQNYPNPFNPSTVIKFDLNRSKYLKLAVYDVNGSLVKTLARKNFDKGRHSFEFNAGDLSSGVYFYSLQDISGNEISRKMLLLK